LTIAGVALSGLSTGINAAASGKVQRARDDAMAAERIRQGGLDQEASALNTQSQDRYQNFEAQQGEKASSLADYFTGQQVTPPSEEAALPTSSNNLVVQEGAKQKAEAKAFTDRTGTALGNMRSFGDLLGDTSRLQARDAGQIGQIGGFKRGSSNVLGYELDNANNAGNGLKLFGDLASGFGGIALNSGISGGTLSGLFGRGAGVPKVGSVVPVPTARPANPYNLYGGG
jgi:hypothetical protein